MDSMETMLEECAHQREERQQMAKFPSAGVSTTSRSARELRREKTREFRERDCEPLAAERALAAASSSAAFAASAFLEARTMAWLPMLRKAAAPNSSRKPSRSAAEM